MIEPPSTASDYPQTGALLFRTLHEINILKFIIQNPNKLYACPDFFFSNFIGVYLIPPEYPSVYTRFSPCSFSIRSTFDK